MVRRERFVGGLTQPTLGQNGHRILDSRNENCPTYAVCKQHMSQSYFLLFVAILLNK